MLISLLLFRAAVIFADVRENFLSHGPSVSSYGRGETGTAVFDGNSSDIYNPSLLTEANGDGLILAEHSLFDGSAYSYGGINTYSNTGKVSYGVSVINLRSGAVEIRQNINDNPNIINTNQWAYYLTLSKYLKQFFSLNIGVNVKYINYEMYKYSAGGVGADIGLSREFQGPRLSGSNSTIYTGFSVLNIIPPSIKLLSEDEMLNTIYRIGASFSLPVVYRMATHDNISIYIEAALQENMLNQAYGAEYCFVEKYFLRSGYYKEHPTSGAGIKFRNITFDYAIDFGSLENINRFSLAFNWGGNKSQAGRTGSSNSMLDDTLMKEAKQALKIKEHDNDKLDKEVAPLFEDALKDYKKKRYLLAADKFRGIMLKFPQYENAGFYYRKINDDMYETSQTLQDSDLERMSYAKGYVSYREQNLNESINEWEKVLQINPERSEIALYLSKVREYLVDVERIKSEKETEVRIMRLFEDGKSNYAAGKWIMCVKIMEKVQTACKNAILSSSFELYEKAQGYIDNSINELSKIIYAKSIRESDDHEDNLSDLETDSRDADNKYNEGLILYAQGKTADAIRLWEIAVRLFPSHERAVKAIEKAREELELIKKR